MKPDDLFTLENAAWPALLVNGAGTILRANPAASSFFGQALDGSPSLALIWAAENNVSPERMLAQWERSPAATMPLKFKIKGGATNTVAVSICSFNRNGQKYFLLQCPQDSGARIETEIAQAHKQKLECALQLARTVSLDFNNALTSILGYTSLMLSRMEPDNPWRNALLEVEKSAARAAEIANDLGTFSRQEKESRAQAAGNLNAILQRSVELFQKGDAKEITWTLQLEPKLFAAKLDEAKIQQAFVKILENATQAIDQAGRINVQTRNVELRESTHDRELRLAAGTYVCVEINDTGCGIDPQNLPRIFEPFFTTKKAAGHRGLGLALVYGIVSNHGGGVAVSSQRGVGTSVRVYLPAENRVVRDGGIGSKDLSGNQTILMVDDEDLLLTMGQTILSAFGYRVLTANTGQKALETFRANPAKVDLVITDLVMPGMSGRELAEHIGKLSPETPILYTSGFVRSVSREEEVTYLQKPFTSTDLLTKVKAVLGRNH